MRRPRSAVGGALASDHCSGSAFWYVLTTRHALRLRAVLVHRTRRENHQDDYSRLITKGHEYDTTMADYPKLVSLSGWLLVILGGLIAVVAIVGAAAVLYASSPSAQARAEERLHEVHYVIQPHWSAVVVFLVCLLLGEGIGFLGYFQTKHSVERRISDVEQRRSSEPPPR